MMEGNFSVKLILITLICFQFFVNCGPGSTDVSTGQNDPSPAPTQYYHAAQPDWKPAVFKGLVIGKATRGDFLVELGSPIDSSESSNDLPEGVEPEIVDRYAFQDGFSGYVEISSDKKTGVVSGAIVYPDNLTFQDLPGIYGIDFIFSKYEFLECPGDAGSSLLRESPDGAIEYLEYRAKGIVVDLDENKNRVESIEFIAGPVGTKDCPKRLGSQ